MVELPTRQMRWGHSAGAMYSPLPRKHRLRLLPGTKAPKMRLHPNPPPSVTLPNKAARQSLPPRSRCRNIVLSSSSVRMQAHKKKAHPRLPESHIPRPARSPRLASQMILMPAASAHRRRRIWDSWMRGLSLVVETPSVRFVRAPLDRPVPVMLPRLAARKGVYSTRRRTNPSTALVMATMVLCPS